MLGPEVPEITEDLPCLDDEPSSDYFSAVHSRQASSVCCLDEILTELEERRDSSVLFVEEELNEEDNDSGIFLKPTQKFQLRWKIKPRALLKNGSKVVSSVSNRWHRLAHGVCVCVCVYMCMWFNASVNFLSDTEIGYSREVLNTSRTI